MAQRNFIINGDKGATGMLMSQRRDSMKNFYQTKKAPFYSRISIKEQIGLPPIKGTIIERKGIKEKTILRRQIKREKSKPDLCSMERYNQLCPDKQYWKKNINPLLEKKTSDDIDRSKLNKTLGEISREVTFQESQRQKLGKSSLIDEVDITPNNNMPTAREKNFPKIEEKDKAPKIIQIKKKVKDNNINMEKEKVDYDVQAEDKKEEPLPTLNDKDDEINKEEMNDILNYINSLDYETYSKDMEIKEALQLLKNKMDKDKEEKKEEEEKQKEKVQIIKEEEKPIQKEENPEKLEEKEEPKPPKPIEKPVEQPKEVENEEEEKKKEEIKKYKLAEMIAKEDRLKAVHSIQSVRRLLEREGLNDPKRIDPLKITVIQEKSIFSSDDALEKKLPFLHSLPLI